MLCFQGASAGYPSVVHPVPRRWQNGIHHLTKMMNLKKLKRRLSLTFKGNRGLESSLADLTEQMTIEDSNGITKETKQGNQSTFILFWCYKHLPHFCHSNILEILKKMSVHKVWKLMFFFTVLGCRLMFNFVILFLVAILLTWFCSQNNYRFHCLHMIPNLFDPS